MRLAVLFPPRFPIKTHSLDRRFRGAHFATGCQLKQQLSSLSDIYSRMASQSLENLKQVNSKVPLAKTGWCFMLTYVHLHE